MALVDRRNDGRYSVPVYEYILYGPSYTYEYSCDMNEAQAKLMVQIGEADGQMYMCRVSTCPAARRVTRTRPL